MNVKQILSIKFFKCQFRHLTTQLNQDYTNINGCHFEKDQNTNISLKILDHIGRNLHNVDWHPLCFIKKKIVDYFYKEFKGRTGNPLFSFYDDLIPVVSIEQNFDSLLIPKDHPSRSKSDCYYLNRNYMLRGHMTAHQAEMLKAGLDNFLLFGDVYRRDEIDSTHYPVFHQCDAVRLCNLDQIENIAQTSIKIFEGGKETHEKQNVHTIDATKIMEGYLKSNLIGLVQNLFGNVKYRWVDVYFPFTHPSWELEIDINGIWVEVLGCGIIRHEILKTNGAEGRIGYAFGLGLERLAMRLYNIPDIRLFWSEDTGFKSQFINQKYTNPIEYKTISVYPQCSNDLSFWIPDNYDSNDFYELVRNTGGDLIEQVEIVDKFKHPKTGRESHCYRIIYRHLHRTLTKEEVNKIHTEISDKSMLFLGVEIR